MSKNISIQENGVAQTLNTISVVETKGSPSGSVDWVPEDECQLGQVVVRSNGEVTASDEGYYAFSKVSVNVPPEECKAVGMNEDGEWEVWGVDEDGELVELGLPTRIEVVTPPNKTSYIVGEPINTKGMVVMGYFEDDSEYGVISREEYTIDPMIAPSRPSEDYKDNNGITVRKFSIKEVVQDGSGYRAYYIKQSGTDYLYVYLQNSSNTFPLNIYLTKYASGGLYHGYVGWEDNGKGYQYATVTTNGSSSGGSDGQYISAGDSPSFNALLDMLPETSVSPYGKRPSSFTPVSPTQIEVKWARIGDGEELTTTFDITVNPILT